MKEIPKKVTKPSAGGIQLPYLVYVPGAAAAEPEKLWPTIFFLHGVGERGSDARQVSIYGIPAQVEKDEDFPFITISPQCPVKQWWTGMLDELDILYQEVLVSYPVDPECIYLTGLSMGGYGAWAWAARHPDRFAALAPICGGGNPEWACKLKQVPTWVFHGAKDNTVPLIESQAMVDALKRCGGDVRFTVYPNAGHDSWTQTYNNPVLYQWFLEHKK